MMNVAKEIYQYILGVIIILGAFALTYLLIFNEAPAGSKEVLSIAFGVILGKFGSVIDYFFGSSKSSSDKNELLTQAQAQLIPDAVKTTTTTTETKTDPIQ